MSRARNRADGYDDDPIQTNIALLGFKTAVNGSLAKYNLQDQVIDEYTNATGINATPSTNHVLTSGVYSSGEDVNYFGSGTDGAFTSNGSDTQAVTQIGSGVYDGNMIVKNYTSMNIQFGHTYTPDLPCRGMLIYVSGDCIINGTLTMTAKGAFSGDPSSVTTSSDSASVSSTGIRIPMRTASGSSTLSAADFAGCGTPAVSAVANQEAISGNGTIFTIARTGAALVTSPTSGASNGRTDGNDGTTGQSGGGGSGARSENIPGGDSAAGTCFSGGSGGGGGDYPGGSGDSTGGDAVAFGGSGGQGINVGIHASNGGGGGAGNPGGAASLNSSASTVGENGTGGLLILVVKGTLSGSGAITSHGKDGGNCTGNDTGGGGGSGGGNILILAGATTHSGARTATGGLGGTFGSNSPGGAGGDGSVQGPTLVQTQILGGLDYILQSTDTTAEAAPTKADMVIMTEDTAGTATLNTDIKGLVSRDSGVSFTEGVLVDEGHWGDGTQRILAFHDLPFTSSTGTDMCYKITTHNQSASKVTKIHATSIGWR